MIEITGYIGIYRDSETKEIRSGEIHALKSSIPLGCSWAKLIAIIPVAFHEGDGLDAKGQA